MPEISVIVPVYNVEKYLHRCVDSILSQTFTDFELILVDDGSSDNCGNICDEYAKKDPRIVVFHQENQGQAVARNRALDIVKGKYIAFVDSDDFIHEQMFEVLFDNIIRTNSMVSICNHQSTNGSVSGEPIINRCEIYNGREFLVKCFKEKTGKQWLLWDKLFNKDCFNEIRLPVGRIYEDNATVYKILYNAHKVVYCDDILYYYYNNPSSTVRAKFSLKNLDWLLVLQEMIVFFEEKKEEELSLIVGKMYLSSLADSYLQVYKILQDLIEAKKLKNLLKKQYNKEKRKYRITFDSMPEVLNILHPLASKIYWKLKALSAIINKNISA